VDNTPFIPHQIEDLCACLIFDLTCPPYERGISRLKVKTLILILYQFKAIKSFFLFINELKINPLENKALINLDILENEIKIAI